MKGMTALFGFQVRIWPRGDCWEWRGKRTGETGYGKYSWLPLLGEEFVHRHAYELGFGPVPGKLVVDHLCQHRWCVRPSHLEAVTQGENNRRSSRYAKRRYLSHCKYGHAFTTENTVVQQGHRRCRTCVNLKAAEYQRAKRLRARNLKAQGVT